VPYLATYIFFSFSIIECMYQDCVQESILAWL
jgi:hypothetical protein